MSTIILDNFPRHATSTSSLRPDQIATLKLLANAVVGALLANHRAEVLVEGFADLDANGRDFEQQVSMERARNGRDALLAEIRQLAGQLGVNADQMAALSIQTAAFGSQRRVVAQPRNEDERRLNRRIHVTVTGTPIPGITTTQALDRAVQALPLVRRPGPHRRLSCLLGKLRDPAAMDGYFDFDALKQMPGSAGWPALSPDQFAVLLRATTRHCRGDLVAIARNAPDQATMAAGIEQLDDNIGRNIANFEAQLVGDSATGRLMRTFNASIGHLQLDALSILSCYAGYARIRHDH